ncbi:uncharacterized protein TNCV_4882031 [Trichonephila clavipes]|nr:uncharacterized protein TNCV_4882031 [Trichonephila clavipes]
MRVDVSTLPLFSWCFETSCSRITVRDGGRFLRLLSDWKVDPSEWDEIYVPDGLGLNPEEDMDVCSKCIEHLRHGGTLNSRRVASPLVWLVEGIERWDAPYPPCFLLQNWGGIVLSHFSDEAHYFWLNGYVNKQNCRIWSEANPQVYVETPLHQEKLTVWSALWAGGIIGPYLFKNDEGHNVTVNGDRYRAMITTFFIPELNNHDVQELWFQQDGATCHTARATIDLLKYTFGDRLISRFGPVKWPPRSCDLKPLDYFLWGYVKSMRISHKRLTIWKTTFAVLLPIYGHKCWKKSSKIGRQDWTTSDFAVAVLCQKSYLKCNATRLSFE